MTDDLSRMADALGADAISNPGEGRIGVTYTKAGPTCQDKCSTKNRPAWDSPAAFGKERGTGRKLVYCTCCNHELLSEDDRRAKEAQLITNFRPPNLNPALEAGAWKRFVDIECLYDVVVLKDVKEIK